METLKNMVMAMAQFISFFSACVQNVIIVVIIIVILISSMYECFIENQAMDVFDRE